MKFLKKHWVFAIILIFAALIRLWRLSGIPVSLFGDELDVGYHAYSILKTARDYSGNFLPLHFQSLAEWRTPLYLYSAVPTVALFGISPLGVRLPAVIFGVLGVWGMFLLARQLSGSRKVALVAALVAAASPWHIQYSRGGFEVTMLLAFLVFGLYFFFKSLKDGRYLWVGASLLVLTPLIYSTAKVFTLFLLVFLFAFWRKELFALDRRHLLKGALALLVLGSVVTYATLFSGGGQRFSYISVFTDPTIEPEVGVARLRDARMRGEEGEGLSPTFVDRVLHNKFVFWADRVSDNYVQAFSTDFLFTKGDPNPRHSMNGMGQFYKMDFPVLLIGVVLFFTLAKGRKKKLLVLFLILAGAFPAALTRDGGNHATRLILILPGFIFLISWGVVGLVQAVGKKYGRFVLPVYLLGLLFSFCFYWHNYLFHYPWDSERWWHAGWGEAVASVKEKEADFSRVFVSMADEPAWIFFAAWYEYPPPKWHEGFPMETKQVEGFGEISFIDKYHFGSIDKQLGGIYALSDYITDDDLYLASAKEVGGNLIMEPAKTPLGLKMVKSVSYPSGEPAFYLFTADD